MSGSFRGPDTFFLFCRDVLLVGAARLRKIPRTRHNGCTESLAGPLLHKAEDPLLDARIGDLVESQAPYIILTVIFVVLFFWAFFHDAAKPGRRKAFYIGFALSLPIIAMSTHWAITTTNESKTVVSQANIELREKISDQYGLEIVNRPLGTDTAGKLQKHSDVIVANGLSEVTIALSFDAAGAPVLDMGSAGL